MQKLRDLWLFKNNLTGSIPSSLNNCTSLTSLRLSSNKLKGEITLDFAQFSNLSSLSLSDNAFRGTVPEDLSECTKLTVLDLSRNNLTGTLILIPHFITNFPSLRVLSVANNELEGPLPDWIWRLEKLQVLDLSGNHLNGKLPTSFKQLAGMRLPNTFSSNTTLYELVLLTIKGTMQEVTTIIRSMTSIDLSRNNHSGDLPPLLGSLYALHLLNLSDNHFTRFIPANLANISVLESLDLSNNELTGNILPEVANLDSLGTLVLANNSLSGKIPTPGGTRFPIISYIGNQNLCGLPLPSCDIPEPSQQSTDEHSEDMFSAYMSIPALSTGFPIGTRGVWIVLFSSKRTFSELSRYWWT